MLYEVAHRRWGKDEIALHFAARSALLKEGTYWHMLPQASQARKAIWEAVNPHTGKRRIDEAFPEEIRQATRENEMFIKFVNGSTWQVVGSDNYDSLVGSPPVGVVFSEWALAKPQAWAYLRPILVENGGWAAFITTPRGNNHAAKMYKSMQNDPRAFVEKSTAEDTDVFTPEQLEEERNAYIAEYGDSIGKNLFEQEYMCSFDAAVHGSIYAKELNVAESNGRIKNIEYQPDKLVNTAWDIGIGDSTAIWFFQIQDGRYHFIDYYECNNEPITHYLSVLQAKDYDYDTLFMPHDADNRQFASKQGESIADMTRKNGFKVEIVPKQSVENGINAARILLKKSYFDKENCRAGLDALINYKWAYNNRLSEFKATPEHDWASHGADAFRYAAQANPREPEVMKPIDYEALGMNLGIV